MADGRSAVPAGLVRGLSLVRRRIWVGQDLWRFLRGIRDHEVGGQSSRPDHLRINLGRLFWRAFQGPFFIGGHGIRRPKALVWGQRGFQWGVGRGAMASWSRPSLHGASMWPENGIVACVPRRPRVERSSQRRAVARTDECTSRQRLGAWRVKSCGQRMGRDSKPRGG